MWPSGALSSLWVLGMWVGGVVAQMGTSDDMKSIPVSIETSDGAEGY